MEWIRNEGKNIVHPEKWFYRRVLVTAMTDKNVQIYVTFSRGFRICWRRLPSWNSSEGEV
jgi:hypothetical protein